MTWYSQVYTSAFIGIFKKVVGIEFLDSLLQRGEKRTHRWEKFKAEFTPTIQQVQIQWISSDFVDNPNWTEATFIVLHWTAFSLESRKLITKYLNRCAEGTHVITFTAPIESKDYEMLLTDTCDTSWGKADFYFHEKITANRVSN